MAQILYVEDEVDLREEVAEELVDMGHTVVEAGDGLKGLEALADMTPDLILCDINMPRMDGYEFLVEIRTGHPELASVPFIFITAFSDHDNVIKGIKLGADDYVVKPIDMELLNVKISLFLKRLNREKEPRKQPDKYG